MAKKKVLLARNLPEAVIARAEELFDLTVREKTQPMTPSEMRSGLAIYDGMMPSLGDHFSADIFNPTNPDPTLTKKRYEACPRA